mmetsp:Transcript_16995/g.44216  ORF Transcript_16995/g.44216 Transcript_16995/m.44216 type:complete len:218 (+) Transcript_16995:789-1442(+)
MHAITPRSASPRTTRARRCTGSLGVTVACGALLATQTLYLNGSSVAGSKLAGLCVVGLSEVRRCDHVEQLVVRRDGRDRDVGQLKCHGRFHGGDATITAAASTNANAASGVAPLALAANIVVAARDALELPAHPYSPAQAIGHSVALTRALLIRQKLGARNKRRAVVNVVDEHLVVRLRLRQDHDAADLDPHDRPLGASHDEQVAVVHLEPVNVRRC